MKDVDRGPIAAIVTWWAFQLPVAVVDDGTPFYTILEQKKHLPNVILRNRCNLI